MFGGSGTNGRDNIAVAANGGVVDVTIGGGVAELIQTLVDLGSGE